MLCRKALAWADTTYLNRLHPEEDLVLVGAALYCVLYGVGWKQLTLMRYWWANPPDWVFTCALATFSCSTSEELPNLGGGLSDSPTAIHLWDSAHPRGGCSSISRHALPRQV